MWGRAMGGARLLPLLLLLLLPGAVGLQCLSCGAEDGTCRGAANVTCPPESDVCAEVLVAVTWSHGRWALGGRGCGRGRGGAIARAVELPGVTVFERRRHCGGRGCNGLLPLGTDGALPLPGNASGAPPNGLRCYGCHDDGRCSPPAVVECYGDLRGCFRGNVSLALGGATVWREVRGCVRDAECREERRGDAAVGLRGSCCAGDLCNGPAPNKTFFAPDLPRLELLPHGHAPTAAPNATKMAAGAATPTPGLGGGGGEGNGSLGGSRATPKMAATPAKMATTPAKMAAGTTGGASGANGVNGVNGVNGNLANANMAAVDANMEAVDANMAAVDTNMAAVDANMEAVDANMAAVDANMAAVDADVAAVDAVEPRPPPGEDEAAAAGDKMAAGGKMAAGRAGSGRPLERKDGIKGRGHPIGGPGWLLPLLLLPLL